MGKHGLHAGVHCSFVLTEYRPHTMQFTVEKEITLAGSTCVCFLQFAWKNPSGVQRKLLLLCGAAAFMRMNKGARGARHILPDLRLGLNKRGCGLLLREGDDIGPVFGDPMTDLSP